MGPVILLGEGLILAVVCVFTNTLQQKSFKGTYTDK